MEDNSIICQVHKIYLDDRGYQVKTTENGKRTLAICKNNFYALIILDGVLPDMKGVELGKKIRKLESESQMTIRKAILLLSAYSADLLGKWCKEAEIDSFILKPVCYEDLFFILKGYFARVVFSRAA